MYTYNDHRVYKRKEREVVIVILRLHATNTFKILIGLDIILSPVFLRESIFVLTFIHDYRWGPFSFDENQGEKNYLYLFLR